MGFALTATALVLAAWLAGWVILFRLPRCRTGAAGRHPAVSIIIPARNEERNLPRLLRSLRTQDLQPHEVLVVDDGSEDQTAVLAREGGARVLESEPLPDGWRGKAWACQQGARAARGEVFLFLDADTYLLPDGYRRLLDTFTRVDGALSVGPYHKVRHPYENLSAFFNLLMMAGVGAFSAWSRPGRAAGLFGPCLMISAKDYASAGGHEAVRNQVLENLYLAKPLSEAGVGRFCFGGRGTLAFRMYPDGLGSLISGWQKAFAAGATRTPPMLHLLIVLWLTGAALMSLLLPIAGAAGSPHQAWMAVAAHLLFALQIGCHLRRIGNFSLLAALFYPIPLAFFFGVFFLSKRGRKAVWKGRDVSAPKR